MLDAATPAMKIRVSRSVVDIAKIKDNITTICLKAYVIEQFVYEILLII